jgi:LPXTG-site transpeptidase (sortase) family protein
MIDLRKYILFIFIGWTAGLTSTLAFPLYVSRITETHASVSLPKWRTEITLPEPGVPVRLIIPSLSVNSAIEPVGKDADERMAVPKNLYNAGWYEYGVRPGKRGNAVIDGHVNTPNLTPNIFYNIDRLKTGDSIIVVDSTNRVWYFQVKRVANVETVNFPINEVFGQADNPRLNLVTCTGVYSHNNADYTERTVVYSELSGNPG